LLIELKWLRIAAIGASVIKMMYQRFPQKVPFFSQLCHYKRFTEPLLSMDTLRYTVCFILVACVWWY